MAGANDLLSSLISLRTMQMTQYAFNQAMNHTSAGIHGGGGGPASLIGGGGTHSDAALAGLESAISANIRATNAADTASGGLNQISDLLDQAKSLVSANAGNDIGDIEKQANQSEINSILDTVNRIANTNHFARRKLLDGTGSIRSSNAKLSIDSANTSDLGQTEIDGSNYSLADLAGGGSLDTTGANVKDAATVLDAAIDDVATSGGAIGAFVSDTLQPQLGDILSERKQLLGSLLSIIDTNSAQEASAKIRAELLGQTSLLLTGSIGKQQHIQAMLLSVLG